MMATVPARITRSESTHIAAMSGLAATTIPLATLLVAGALTRRFNLFLVLVALGIVGCIRGVAFYNLEEIKNCFRQASFTPPGGPADPNAGPRT